ncbi:MAG TPA: DUF4177 domain-containing protein [Steroidobacteraceae bacterium]|nr:DUF4177 domain-containing protein [Steroidobacteraceae bacterium]
MPVEYKQVLLPYKPSNFQSDDVDIQNALNAEAKQNWRLCQLVQPSTLWGRAAGMIAILERQTD